MKSGLALKRKTPGSAFHAHKRQAVQAPSDTARAVRRDPRVFLLLSSLTLRFGLPVDMTILSLEPPTTREVSLDS